MKTSFEEFKTAMDLRENISDVVGIIEDSSLGMQQSILELLFSELDSAIGVLLSIDTSLIVKEEDADNNEASSLIKSISHTLMTMPLKDQIIIVSNMCSLINDVVSGLRVDLFGIKRKNFSAYIDKTENLTLEKAKSCIGKYIVWDYAGYNRKPWLRISKIGSLTTEWDFIKDIPYGSTTRGEYLHRTNISYVNRAKETTCIIDHNGNDTNMRELGLGWYNEPTFTCSDADREVDYILVDKLI